MTDPRIYDAFDVCLTQLGAGEPLAACLERYPDLAGELRPMLEAAQLTLAVSRAPHHAQMRSRARFLGAAAQRRPSPSSTLVSLLRRALSTAIAVCVGFALGTTGLYYASASTLPGDGLYSVKRTFEDVRVQLAVDPASRLKLEQEYSQRRENETETLVSEGRTAEVTFGGVLTGRTESDWQVGDFTVRVTDDTDIIGDPRIGLYVDVTAELENGRLNASRVIVQEKEITGELTRDGDRWAINGVTFAIVPETIVSGKVESGATATARLRTLQSGDVVAVSLTALAPATPSATATPPASLAPTNTPVPSATPEPSHTPEPSERQEPTESPERSETKEPRPTSEPSKAVEPSKTPKAAETHEPSRTPEPTRTQESGGGSGGGDGGGGSGGGGGGDGGGSGGGGGGDG